MSTQKEPQTFSRTAGWIDRLFSELSADRNSATQPGNTASIQPQYSDPLDRFWHLYLVDADKQDLKLAERWKGHTDGILIFVRAARHFPSVIDENAAP
jgi:hypothetical protein